LPHLGFGGSIAAEFAHLLLYYLVSAAWGTEEIC
jgi:hypothetical protein